MASGYAQACARMEKSDLKTTPELAYELARPRVLAFWEGGSSSYFLPRTGAVTVGRGERCELQIDHASASREHARITSGQPVTIEDLDSFNGVRVRGVRIAPRTPTPIATGDVIELGAAVIVLQEPRGEEPSSRGSATSDVMRATERLLDLVSQSDITVLLLGETGVGKNVAAARIHTGSRRSAAPLVAINCAALPEPLLEAELFGFERGAFTGALQPKRGLVEAADGGTLLLDEIGEMPLATQAKLLSVVETRQVTRLGSVTPSRVDVRFIAATNRNLEARVADGLFREDLYYRLNGISITIPPLRERVAEIATRATAFLAEACARTATLTPRITADAIVRLEAHAWPGNLRELRNTMERAIVLAGGGVEIKPEHLQLVRPSAGPPPFAPSHPPGGASGSTSLRDDVDALEKQRVLEALDRCGGNQTQAAKALGISRTALIARIEAFKLPRPRKK